MHDASPGAEYHPVPHPDQAAAAVLFDYLSIEQIGQRHPAGLRAGTGEGVTRRLYPATIVGQDRGRILLEAIREEQRDAARRFVGEMEEIANAFQAAGLPDNFHRAAAELYRRLERYKDTDQPPSLEEATAVILQLNQRDKEPRLR
jgi:Domain of unknown function (DUF1932)